MNCPLYRIDLLCRPSGQLCVLHTVLTVNSDHLQKEPHPACPYSSLAGELVMYMCGSGNVCSKGLFHRSV
jgi:hypothetical protein